MLDVTSLIKRFGKTVTDNSPAILTATAVAGVLTTAVLTGKAAILADRMIRAAEQVSADAPNEEDDLDLYFPLTARERVELVWTLYIPPVLTGASTMACIIAANQIGSRRNAALLSAYSFSETAFREYKDKVVEQIGAKKEQTVRDAVAEDRIKASPPSTEIIMVEGEVLFCELKTMRYFRSTQEKIRRAENDINAEINNNMYASLSDFYNLIGLQSTDDSDDLGWNLDRRLDIQFSAVLQDGKPMIGVSYGKAPFLDFHRVL